MLFLVDAEESSLLLSLIRTLLLNVCNIIYKFIITFYELFLAVGDATILNNEQIQPIFSRVGLILGIIMLFRLIFSFVQYMIDPDKISDKEAGMGNLIKKVLVVIIALGLSNWVFTKAFEIQHIILEENTVGKVILGMPGSSEIDMTEYGILFSYEIFSIFYHQSDGLTSEGLEDAEEINCGPSFYDKNNGTLIRYIATYKDFEATHMCVNEAGNPEGGNFGWGNKVYYTQFDGLTAIVVGIFVLWVLLMYTITLGVRVIKLAFLRIIAPVPILSYLSPKKDTAFQRWIKQCVTTYLDLFIRLAIIYFALYLISMIFNSTSGVLNAATWLPADSNLWKSFQLILVLGILLFAKKVPDLISDLFPGMGGKSGLDFGLGLKSRTDFLGKNALKRGIGALAGGAAIGFLGASQGFRRLTAAGVQATGRKRALNTLTGLGTGMFRGITTGAKGGKIGANLKNAYKTQVGASAATNKYIAAGGDSFKERLSSSIAREFGFPTAYDRTMAEVNQKNRQIDKNDKISGQAGKVSKGRDAIGDTLKGEIEGDKSKTTIDANIHRGAIDHLLKEGKLAEIRDNNGNLTGYGFILGEENVRDASGRIIGTRQKIGKNIIGQKFSDVDNDFENAIRIAENTLNTSNANLTNSETQRQKLVSQKQVNANRMQTLENAIRNFDSSTATAQEITAYNDNIDEYTSLQSQQSQLDREIASVDSSIIVERRNVEDAERLLSSINKTTLVKKLKESAMVELFLGNYDSADAVVDLETNLSDARQSSSRIHADAADRKLSTDPIQVKIGEQFDSVAKTMDVLLDLSTDIRTNSDYFTVDSSGNKVYDIDKVNQVIADKVSQNPELFSQAVNLDSVNEDGTFGIEPLEVKSVHDVWDKLAELNKKVERYENRENARLKTEKEVLEQSAKTMQERIADDNRLGGKN